MAEWWVYIFAFLGGLFLSLWNPFMALVVLVMSGENGYGSLDTAYFYGFSIGSTLYHLFIIDKIDKIEEILKK